MIEIENLVHRYPGDARNAVDKINLVINPGEFVAILGHNGSGKSTVARHLNALLLPTAGAVRIDGLNTSTPNNLWQIRQKVGLVLQNPDNQLVATVVEEDVAFGPENLGLPPAVIRQRVDEALRFVGMENYRQYEPHRLSGGQKQRVAIAGILAMRPKYLVLDEPTAMLDPVGRDEVNDVLHRLNTREGLTIILITHHMDEAARAKRVVVMAEGTIRLDGAPGQVFSDVQTVRGLGLDLPPVAEIADKLKRKGLALPGEMITLEEMVHALCS